MKAKCSIDAMNCYDDVSHIEEKEENGSHRLKLRTEYILIQHNKKIKPCYYK